MFSIDAKNDRATNKKRRFSLTDELALDSFLLLNETEIQRLGAGENSHRTKNTKNGLLRFQVKASAIHIYAGDRELGTLTDYTSKKLIPLLRSRVVQNLSFKILKNSASNPKIRKMPLRITVYHKKSHSPNNLLSATSEFDLYASGILRITNFVLSAYGKLLTSEETNFCGRILEKDFSEALRLLSRLYMRRHVYFNPEAIDYPEVLSIPNAFQALSEAKCVTSCERIWDSEDHFKLFLRSIPLKMLKDVSFAIFNRAFSKTRTALEAHICEYFFRQAPLFASAESSGSESFKNCSTSRQKLFAITGKQWVVLSDSCRETLELLTQLAFCNFTRDESEALELSTIGIVKFHPKLGALCKNMSTLFRSRAELEDFRASMAKLQRILAEKEAKQWESAYELYKCIGVSVVFDDISQLPQTRFCGCVVDLDGSFVADVRFKFRKEYVTLQSLHYSIEVLEKLGKYRECYGLLVYLLGFPKLDEASCDCVQSSRRRRSYWWSRLLLVTETHLKRPQQAFRLCKLALRDCWIPGALQRSALAYLPDIVQRTYRLWNRDRKGVSPLRKDLKNWSIATAPKDLFVTERTVGRELSAVPGRRVALSGSPGTFVLLRNWRWNFTEDRAGKVVIARAGHCGF